MAQSSKKKPAGKPAAAMKKKAASAGRKKPAGKPASARKPAIAKKKKAASAGRKKPAAKPASATKKKPASASKKNRLDKKFLDAQRTLLREERAKYLHSADILEAEADSLLEAREPGDVQFDEESGEGDTLAVERERDLALSAQARSAVREIDAALERIEGGTYGVCVMSGKPIPKERLQAIPWAAERVEYKAGGIRR